MIMLDTSVLVSLGEVVLDDEDYVVSAISYAELAFGIEHARGAKAREARLSQLMAIEDLGFTWLPFDRSAGAGYGKVAAAIAKTRPGHARSKDAMLAGHAYSLGASVATLNPANFAASASLVPVVVPGWSG